MHITKGNIKKKNSNYNYLEITYFDSKANNPYDKIYINGKEYNIKAGKKFIINKNSYYYIKSVDKKSLRTYSKKIIYKCKWLDKKIINKTKKKISNTYTGFNTESGIILLFSFIVRFIEFPFLNFLYTIQKKILLHRFKNWKKEKKKKFHYSEKYNRFDWNFNRIINFGFLYRSFIPWMSLFMFASTKENVNLILILIPILNSVNIIYQTIKLKDKLVLDYYIYLNRYFPSRNTVYFYESIIRLLLYRNNFYRVILPKYIDDKMYKKNFEIREINDIINVTTHNNKYSILQLILPNYTDCNLTEHGLGFLGKFFPNNNNLLNNLDLETINLYYKGIKDGVNNYNEKMLNLGLQDYKKVRYDTKGINFLDEFHEIITKESLFFERDKMATPAYIHIEPNLGYNDGRFLSFSFKGSRLLGKSQIYPNVNANQEQLLFILFFILILYTKEFSQKNKFNIKHKYLYTYIFYISYSLLVEFLYRERYLYSNRSPYINPYFYVIILPLSFINLGLNVLFLELMKLVKLIL